MDHPREFECLWAAVVVYRPDLKALAITVDRLTPQVQTVLIVDNTPHTEGLESLCRQLSMRYLAMRENGGTGAAMNRVWELMRSERVDGLICFDQDSECDSSIVMTLIAAWNQLEATGRRLGAVGPVWRDRRNQKLMTTLAPKGWFRRPVNLTPSTEVDHLITSGCLIPRAVFEEVGPYNEAFFLDCVDIEWCLRARARGYQLFVVRDAELGHAIGEQVLKVGVASLMVHSPQRTYLMVRNHVALWKMPWLPVNWKLRDIVWVGIRSAALLSLAPQKKARLMAIAQGVWHGLINNTKKSTKLWCDD